MNTATLTPEHQTAKAKAILIALAIITKLDQVSDWLDELNSFLAFHPDTPFVDYTDKEKRPIFADDECAALERAMVQAITVCVQEGTDIYDVCIESARLVGALPLDWDQATDDMQCCRIGRDLTLCCTRGLDDADKETWELVVLDSDARAHGASTTYFTEEQAKANAPHYLQAWRKTRHSAVANPTAKRAATQTVKPKRRR